jgi:hypothetical protein
MPPELKLQVFFAVLLCLSLLGVFMMLARTLAGLEYAMNRIEEVMGRELSLASRQMEREKEAAKMAAQQKDRRSRNDLLLNIPFMDRLNKEKQKGNG